MILKFYSNKKDLQYHTGLNPENTYELMYAQVLY